MSVVHFVEYSLSNKKINKIRISEFNGYHYVSRIVVQVQEGVGIEIFLKIQIIKVLMKYTVIWILNKRKGSSK